MNEDKEQDIEETKRFMENKLEENIKGCDESDKEFLDMKVLCIAEYKYWRDTPLGKNTPSGKDMSHPDFVSDPLIMLGWFEGMMKTFVNVLTKINQKKYDSGQSLTKSIFVSKKSLEEEELNPWNKNLNIEEYEEDDYDRPVIIKGPFYEADNADKEFDEKSTKVPHPLSSDSNPGKYKIRRGNDKGGTEKTKKPLDKKLEEWELSYSGKKNDY